MSSSSPPWLHHGMSRIEAESLLVESSKTGAFLLRESESRPGSYVLSLLHEDKVHHYRIMGSTDGRFFVQAVMGLKQTYFERLEDLIQFYKSPNAGLASHLTTPILKREEEEEEKDTDDDSESDEDFGATKMSKFFQRSFASLKVQEKTGVDEPFLECLTKYVSDGIVRDVESSRTKQKSREYKEMMKFAGKELEEHLEMFMRRVKAMKAFFDQCTGSRKGSTSGNRNKKNASGGLASSLMECSKAVTALEKKSEALLQHTGDMMTPLPVLSQETTVMQPQFSQERSTPMPAPPSHPMRAFEVLAVHAASLGKSKVQLLVDVVEGKLSSIKPGKADSIVSFTHDQIVQLIKSRSHNSKLSIRFEGRGRREFQFEDTKGREIFCQLIQQMRNMHSGSEEMDSISIFIGTWNMGDREPTHIHSWLNCNGSGKTLDPTLSCLPHDIYAIGTQESAMNEKDWVAKIKSALKICVRTEFKQVAVATLWGIRLVILTKLEHINKISHVQQSSVKTGIAGALGNKGATGISFFFNATSLCFINCHLTSGSEKCHRRNNNYYDILRCLQLGHPAKKGVYDLSHRFHHLFWFGDLNYRVECGTYEEVARYLSRRDYQGLLEHDQLLTEQKRGKVFFSFDEDEINFPPTYRYARGTRQKYDYRKLKKTYVRINLPSYCDRVLWKSYPEASIASTSYGCTDDVMTSDHSPVFASFTVGAVAQYAPHVFGSGAQKDLEFRVDRISAMIQTNSTSPFYLEIHSTCINEPVRSKNAHSQPQRAGRYFMNQYVSDDVKYSFPVWGSDDFEQKIYPIIPAKEYLEQQHLLLAVKSTEGDESYGECVISLKNLLAESWSFFESQLLHRGVHTGIIRGDMKAVTEGFKESVLRPRSSYELIQHFISVGHDDDDDVDSGGQEAVTSMAPGVEPRKPAATPPRTRSVRVSKNFPPQGRGRREHSIDVNMAQVVSAMPLPNKKTGGLRREAPAPCDHGDVPPLPAKGSSLPQGSPSCPQPYSPSSSHVSTGPRLSRQPAIHADLAATAAAVARVGKQGSTGSHSPPVRDRAYWIEGKPLRKPPVLPKPSNSSLNFSTKQEIAVHGWLSRIDPGLERYVSNLVRSGWDDPAFFGDLSEEDLMKVGIVNSFHRRQIVQALQGQQ